MLIGAPAQPVAPHISSHNGAINAQRIVGDCRRCCSGQQRSSLGQESCTRHSRANESSLAGNPWHFAPRKANRNETQPQKKEGLRFRYGGRIENQ